MDKTKPIFLWVRCRWVLYDGNGFFYDGTTTETLIHREQTVTKRYGVVSYNAKRIYSFNREILL